MPALDELVFAATKSPVGCELNGGREAKSTLSIPPGAMRSRATATLKPTLAQASSAGALLCAREMRMGCNHLFQTTFA